jgi:Acetyltransferase (GNAT) family
MQAAEDRARERGAERMMLDTSAANVDALRFYARLGYRRRGLLLTKPVGASAAGEPKAPRDLGWRQIAKIDALLERGEIDEAGWHAAMADLIVPAYLAARTPWEGSGKQGTAEDWEQARSLVAHAVDHDGSFLDVGCANGYLLECLPRWTPHRLDRFGLDIAPELIDLARRRVPELADRLFVGNALHWEPPHRLTYVRTGLEYVPRRRRRDLVERLLGWCDRLIIGVMTEPAESLTEGLLTAWGHPPSGRSERRHPRRPGAVYRVLWVDA